MLQILIALAVAVAAPADSSPSAALRIPRVPQVPAPRVPQVPRAAVGQPRPKVTLPDGLPGARQAAWPQLPPLPADLQGLVDRIGADPGSPEWKRTIAERIRTRQIGRFNARLTIYCTDSSVDPQGGGPSAAWDGIPLRWGHAASDWGEIPKGSVLYLPPPVDSIVIVVDNGPGVQGPGRIDVCTTDAGQYFDLCSMVSVNRPLPCWRLGRKTTSHEAR